MNIVVKQRKPPIVPIVSLIDILAILLIFFIATSTFKKAKLGVDIEPPAQGALSARAIDDGRTTLSISSENQIYFGSGAGPVDAASLTSLLGAAFAEDKELELEADEGADFGVVVKALDALKKAGYKEGDYPTILKIQKTDPPGPSGPGEEPTKNTNSP